MSIPGKWAISSLNLKPTKFAIWGNFNLSNLEFENIKNEIQ